MDSQYTTITTILIRTLNLKWKLSKSCDRCATSNSWRSLEDVIGWMTLYKSSDFYLGQNGKDILEEKIHQPDLAIPVQLRNKDALKKWKWPNFVFSALRPMWKQSKLSLISMRQCLFWQLWLDYRNKPTLIGYKRHIYIRKQASQKGIAYFSCHQLFWGLLFSLHGLLSQSSKVVLQ